MTAPYFNLESFPPLTFAILSERLRLFVATKIYNGEFTERGLAANLGISQPHLHNVLKKQRSLRPDFADRLLTYFGMGLLDLVPPDELSAQLGSQQARQVQLWLDSMDPTEAEPPKKGSAPGERGHRLSRLAG